MLAFNIQSFQELRRRFPGNLAVAGLCVAPFMNFNGWEWKQVAFSPQIFMIERVHTLLSSNIFHFSYNHLISTLSALVQDGFVVEEDIGSKMFLANFVILTLSSKILHVLYGCFCANTLGWWEPFIRQGIGLSSTCVALNVLSTHMSMGTYALYGVIPIPRQLSRFCCWIDVLWNSLTFSRYNPTEHLAGILSGLVIVYAPWIQEKLFPERDQGGYVLRTGRRLRTGDRNRDFRNLLQRMAGRAARYAHHPVNLWGEDWHPLAIHLACAAIALTVSWKRRAR